MKRLQVYDPKICKYYQIILTYDKALDCYVIRYLYDEEDY